MSIENAKVTNGTATHSVRSRGSGNPVFATDSVPAAKPGSPRPRGRAEFGCAARRPAPHPRTHAALRRARKLQAILAAEETVWPAWPDFDVLRLMLARRHALFEDRWRSCPERLCKRHRYCVQPRPHCPRRPEPELRPLNAAGYAVYSRIRRIVNAQRRAAAAAAEGA